MSKFIFALSIILILIGVCATAIVSSTSTTTIEGDVSGSISYSHCVSMETSGGNMPRFGVNQTPDYTYDGSQASVLSMGTTAFTRSVKVDQTDSNYYAATTGVAGDYMINAEDTAGMINIQGNEPENMCDQAGMLSGSAESGQYPVSETFEGKTGVIIHGGGAYESEVGLNDADVHLSGAADITSKGYLYQDKRITSMKGFDKNSTDLNLATHESMNTIIRTALPDGAESEVHKRIVSDYTSIAGAFDEVIAAENSNTTVESISEERLDEFTNETVTEPLVNETPVMKESPGLADVANMSIVRE